MISCMRASLVATLGTHNHSRHYIWKHLIRFCVILVAIIAVTSGFCNETGAINSKLTLPPLFETIPESWSMWASALVPVTIETNRATAGVAFYLCLRVCHTSCFSCSRQYSSSPAKCGKSRNMRSSSYFT